MDCILIGPIQFANLVITSSIFPAIMKGCDKFILEEFFNEPSALYNYCGIFFVFAIISCYPLMQMHWK